MARVKAERAAEFHRRSEDHGPRPRRVPGAPWFFEATLKQEIQRRKRRRWRANAVVRMVTRVVLPGSLIVVVVLCSLLAML